MLRLAVVALVVLASAMAVAGPGDWRVWGNDISLPGAVDDAATAERETRALLRSRLRELAPGARDADFAVLANHLDHRGLRTVTFAQTHDGLRVLDASIGFVIGRDRLVVVRANAWPNVQVAPAGRSELAKQLRAIEGALGATAHPTFARVIVADVAGNSPRYRIADAFEAHAKQGIGEWDVYVTPDGEIATTRARAMTATGTLDYNAGIRWGGGTRMNYPASKATILVDGVSTTTGANGSFTWSGTSASTVISSISGPYVRVINTGGASAMQQFTVAPDATAVWDPTGDELLDAQVSAFVYGSIANARARIVNPALATWLDTQVDFHVNETGACNAAYDTSGVHLFRSNAMCTNTARVGDVVFHEYGHGVHANSIIAGMGAFDEHVSEGLADYFATNITGDPGMGRGFFKTDEPLRQIDPPGYERVFPRDMDFDPHVSGLIIGGALWDLRKALIASLGPQPGIAQVEQIFTSIMQRADSMQSTYTAALVGDDDDADLTNSTPNFCAVEAAFGRHGLVPGYAMTTVAPPVVNGRQISLHVTTPSATACPPLAVSSVSALWRANDGVSSELPLTLAGDDWVAEFPEQPDNTVIFYSVDVQFADGSTTTFPNNPADPLYQLFIGDGTPLWCETFDTAPGWEEISNAGLEWQWAPAVVDPDTVDPDAPFSGTFVFGTDITGDGAYRPALRTAVATPVIPIKTFEIVRLQYRRWLTVEDAAFDQATIEVNDAEVWRNASAPAGSLDHVDREWRFHDIDVTPFVIDGALQIRWVLNSDSSKELGGWTLDDACVVGLHKIPYCGDGELDLGEQCDDGNRDSGDGCDATCIDEIESGGGGCCSGGDARSGWLALVVLALLQRRRRASSLVPSVSVSARQP